MLSLGFYTLFFPEKSIADDGYAIFSDPRLAFPLILEFLCMLVMRKNYEVNGHNIAAINFSMFLSLPLIPLLAFFATEALGFESTLSLTYQSKGEFIAVLAGMTLLVFLYFVDKLKTNAFGSWFYLLLPPILLSGNLFFSVKLMQTHDPFSLYSVILFFTGLPLLLVALSQGEWARWQRYDSVELGKLSLSWLCLIPCNVWATQLLSSEIFTLLKRINQIFAGLLMDRLYNKDNCLSTKDKAIVFLLLLLGAWLYFSRMSSGVN